MEQKLYDAATTLPEPTLEFQDIAPMPKKTGSWTLRAITAAAACIILLISIGVSTVEAQVYNEAVQFFNENGLSIVGLDRREVTAVYRDIITESFTYSKTAEVIANSLSVDSVGGYEILQDHPTPEDVERLWNYKNYNGWFVDAQPQGIHYAERVEYNEDDPDSVFFVGSYLEKYDGETLLWSVPVSDALILGIVPVSDGVIIYGPPENGPDIYRIFKYQNDGTLQWVREYNNGLKREYIHQILENPDGSYAVFSMSDFKYFCVTQYSADGKKDSFNKVEVGTYGIWNAAVFGDGYIVQLGAAMTNEYAKIVKIDHKGNITDTFSYGGEDTKYYVTDMLEYNGKIYLSGYSIPTPANAEKYIGKRYEIGTILNYIFDNQRYDISPDELTPLVRNNYTAMLLVCDPIVGTPQEFYSVAGSLGSTLSLNEAGLLRWNTECITTTFFSIATNSFNIGGTSYIFRYTFDAEGKLIRQEKTGETVDYRR